MLYLATLMVPAIVTLIPLFIILRTFGLVNTWLGLVLPYVLGTPTFIALGPLLLLFFLFQKHIVRSIHMSGFK